MSSCFVSIVIPAYNVENFISMTLDSVLNQTLKNFQCVVVDDYSKDSTVDILLSYVKKDTRIKLIRHRANAGLSAARNSGLRFAQGKYVVFLDADDLIMPESLELRAQTIEKSNDSQVIGTYAGSATISMDCRKPPNAKPVKLRMIDFITAGGNCPFNANQPMFKTNLFKKFGGFDHCLKQAEDYNMWIRVLRCGYRFIPTNMQLVTYRQTEGSMIRRNPLLHLDNSYKCFISCYQEFPLNSLNHKFDVNLMKGWDTYISQLHIANRVFEFIGLGLAKGDSKELLLKRLLEYLPDYFDVLESHRPFKNGVKKGIDRFFKKNVDLNSQEFSALASDVDVLYIQFKTKLQLRQNLVNNKDNQKVLTNTIVSLPNLQSSIDILFIPHKDYHVHTICLMLPFLEGLGLNSIVVDISMHYRDEGVVSACEKYNLPFIGYSNFVLGSFSPKALVVFNDWDPILKSILLAAKKSGIPTVGIVEGIQDYLDADTKQNRKAYQTVDYLFLPGEYDRKYFLKSKSNIFVGGIPRVYDLYNKYKNNSYSSVFKKIALINSNFSYGVLIEHRDQWLTLAVSACHQAGYTPVISRHPADKGTLFSEFVTRQNFYEALEQCDVHISRFASGVLEAIAVGKLPIYFNPHNEKVDKFKASYGAYPVCSNKDELAASLLECEYYGVRVEYSNNFEYFLKMHCGSLDKDPASIISEQLFDIMKLSGDVQRYELFYTLLKEIDHVSGCFNNVKTAIEKAELFFDSYRSEGNKEKTLAEVYSYIKAKDFYSAKKIIKELLNNQPNNPAYLSSLDLLNSLDRNRLNV